MEDNKQVKSELETIVEKLKKNQPLTDAERRIAIDKMLDAKKFVRKTVRFATGDELRKVDASPTLPKPPKTGSEHEAPAPKARGFEGGYDSQADVEERTDVTPDSGQATGDPIRTDNAYKTDKKEEAIPTENPAAKPEGNYAEEEYADADNKEFKQPFYEEDRVANIVEGQHKYKDSVRINDIVTKEITKGVKMVGQVLKTYPPKNGQQAVLVKWANGIYKHENTRDIEVLKGSKSPKAVKEEDQKASPPIVEAQKSADTLKGEKPPSEWLDDCVAALERDGADVDEPYAVCTATYQRMKSVQPGDVIKISVEEMRELCPSCADKMVEKRIKFLKFTVSDFTKYKK